MVEDILKDAEERMQAAIRILEEELKRVRTGRASPALVEHITIDYYGIPTPLIQLAAITAPEPRMLIIKPFDPKTLPQIERAIMTSDLGVNPSNDGKQIRLVFPPLTEERRRELVRLVAQRVEHTRVSIRNVRRDAIRDLRDLEDEGMISEDERYRAEKQVNELTEKYIEKVERIAERKEKEILEQ